MKNLIVAAMLLSGCDWTVTSAADPCSGVAFGESLNRGFLLDRTDYLRIVTRLDEQARGQPDAGEPAYVSGASDGGRLIVLSDGPFVSGALPLLFPTAGCVGPGENAYFYAEGGSTFDPVTATLTVSDGGTAADGGQLTRVDLTHVNALGDDGGVLFALPDRTFNVDLP